MYVHAPPKLISYIWLHLVYEWHYRSIWPYMFMCYKEMNFDCQDVIMIILYHTHIHAICSDYLFPVNDNHVLFPRPAIICPDRNIGVISGSQGSSSQNRSLWMYSVQSLQDALRNATYINNSTGQNGKSTTFAPGGK